MEQSPGEKSESEGNSGTTKTIKIRQSITGICLRLSKKRGAMRHFDQFVLEEFAKNFQAARDAHKEGDMETVKEFFEIYV